MALRMSKALRNHINSGGSLRQALNAGKYDAAIGGAPMMLKPAPCW